MLQPTISRRMLNFVCIAMNRSGKLAKTGRSLVFDVGCRLNRVHR